MPQHDDRHPNDQTANDLMANAAPNSAQPANPQAGPTRRWPAEWEPQSAIWLAWPHNPDTWPGRIQNIPTAYAAMVHAIAEVVPVKILTPDACWEQAQKLVGRDPQVELVRRATNDCWIRDYGPTFVAADDQIIGVNWQYNAWGGKYPPWDTDAENGRFVCEHAVLQCEDSPLTCEGGALETDGLGRLLTTPDCLLTDTRNPGWDQSRVASELHQRLGIHEILWLDGGGLEGDDTDGHIDQLARFVSPQHVVCAVCDDPQDVNHDPLHQNYLQLRVWGRDTEPGVEVHRLPIPPRREIDGQRVPESYCNFLMLNSRRLLLPQFGHPASDDFARGLLADLLPGWDITPLDASELVWGLGAFHCASQQQPRAREIRMHTPDSTAKD